jgi:hypothetical protein
MPPRSPTMLRNRLQQVALLTILAVIFASALGCAVHLVSDYDEQTDSTLSELNTDLTSFVNRMIDMAGTPQGTYDANKDFYLDQEAKVDTLIVRAEAYKALNSCPSTQLSAKAVSAAVPSAEISKYLAQMPKDDCSVVLLQLVKGGYLDLQTLHQAQGSKGIPAAARDPILVGGLGALLRAAITVEVAKKTAAAGGANGS